MGIRTAYLKPTNGKTLRENFETDYPQFRDWLIFKHQEALTMFNERILDPKLELFLIENPTQKIETEWSQEAIDQLVSEYICAYCDYGPGDNIFELIGPTMSTRRYDSSSEIINNSTETQLIKVWNYLVSGRSLRNSNPFICPDQDKDVIGFWKPEDQKILCHRLESFANGSEETEGMGFVLSVLDEMKDAPSDLMFYVAN